MRFVLNINALRACVYIYIRQLSSFRGPTLWFIDLTVATCHIQYTSPRVTCTARILAAFVKHFNV